MPTLFRYEARVIRVVSVNPNNGLTAGGETLVIFGLGFVGTAAGTPTVTIGGNAAAVSAFEDQSITCVAPAHAAGAVDVTVQNTDGDSDTFGGAYTYRDFPPPASVSYQATTGAAATRMRLEAPAPTVQQTIGQPFTATMTVEKEPKGLASVALEAFGVSLFAGVVTAVDARTEGRAKAVVWDIEATDYIFTLSRRFPTGPLEWIDVSGTQVITDLMLLSGSGFQSEVEPLLDDVTLKLDGTKDLWSLICEVCERCGAKAFMIGTKVYVFTLVPNIPVGEIPDDVTSDNQDLQWPDNGAPVKVKYDYTQIATRVWIYGAEGIWTVVDDPAAIDKYGYVDAVIVDDTLTSIQELRKLGLAHIAAYSEPIPAVSYATRDLKTMAGKPVRVDVEAEVEGVSTPGWIEGDFIIQTVRIDQIELVESTPSTKPRFQVTASPARVSMRGAAGITGVFQKVGDLAAKERQSPRLSGDVTSDPGGKTTIPPATITNDQLAGCIETDKLRPGPLKDPVVTSTTGGVVRSGLQTINGVALRSGDRVLVKDQADATENGIYVASAATGLWLRATDSDDDAQMTPGILVVDSNTGIAYYLDADAPVAVGTSELRFVPLTGQDQVVLVVGEVATPTGDPFVFSTANAYLPGTLVVYRNGLRQKSGVDVSESTTTTFTFLLDAPSSDELPYVLVDYETGGGGGSVIVQGLTVQGPIGPPGWDGCDGNDGFAIPGPQGPIGATGAVGATGATGATGAVGAQGPQGPAGPVGVDGEDGDSYMTVVTIPKVDPSAAASVHASGDATVTQAVETALSFDTVDYDDYTFFSGGSPTRLTVPSGFDGAYLVTAQAQLAVFAGTGDANLRIYVNGSLEAQASADLTGIGVEPAVQVCKQLALVGGDYVEVKIYLEDSAAGTHAVKGGAAKTFFQIVKQAQVVGGGGSGSPAASIIAAAVTTSEGQAAGAGYGDLATVGPSVTITITGTTAIVWMSAQADNANLGNTAFISVDVSGATTIAASNANGGRQSSSLATGSNSIAAIAVLTGLNPGTHTFKMKYKNDGGSWAFSVRKIAAYGL